MRTKLIFLTAFLLISLSVSAATPPSLLNYQGVLRDGDGLPITSAVTMVFGFYTADVGGTLLWQESQTVTVDTGLFTAALGDPANKTGGNATSLSEAFAGNSAVYLGIKVGTDDEMTPRIRVLSSAYAQNAKTLDGNEAGAFATSVHNHDTSAITTGTLPVVRGGTGLSATGSSGNVLTSNGTGWVSSALPPVIEVDGVIGNEVTNATDATLTRSGSGTSGSPYTLAMNLANANTWTGAQTFSANTLFPGSGIWNTSGRVGIGTTAPDRPLTIKGNTTGDLISLQDNAGLTQWHLKYDGGLNFTETGIAENRLFLKDGGNIGIGTNNPTSPLTVQGKGTNNELVQFKNEAGDNAWHMNLRNGGLNFSESGIADYRLFLNEGGSVGIGTAAPAGKLHVVGPVRVDTHGAEYYQVQQDIANLQWSLIDVWQSFTQVLTGKLTKIEWYCRSPFASGEAVVGTLRIYQGEGTAGQLLSSDNVILQGEYSWRVLVLSQPPSLTAGIKYTWRITIAEKDRYYYQFSDGDVYAWGKSSDGDDYDMRFRTLVTNTVPTTAFTVTSPGFTGLGTDSPSYQLHLSTNSAAKPSTNTWTVASDARLKKNIRPFTEGLEVLERIHPVWYQYNGLAGMPRDEEAIGVVAQDIMEVAPYTVGTFRAKLNSDDKQQTDLYDFNSHALTYLLINAVLELDARTKSLATPDAETMRARSLTNGPEPLEDRQEKPEHHFSDPERPVSRVLGESSGPEKPERSSPDSVPIPSTGLTTQSLRTIEGTEPGDVLVMNPANGDELRPCNLPADPMVVGIAATVDPAEGDDLPPAVSNNRPVVVGGITLVKAEATIFPIQRGDLLVSSDVPGHVMRMETFVPGTVIGKAMEDLPVGTGVIKILVMMR